MQSKNKSAVEKHLEQALANENLAQHINCSCKGACFFNWFYVALFYSAMHYFGAFLESRGQHLPRVHAGDEGALSLAKDKFVYIDNKEGKSMSAGEDYSALFDWRHDACYKFGTKFFPKDSKVGIDALERIKFVVFSQTKMKIKLSKKKNFIVEKLTNNELKLMREAVDI